MLLDIATAPKRDSLHWKQGTIEWEELCGWAEAPGRIKECGNYVLGKLRETVEVHDGVQHTGLHRTKMAIVSRGAVTLDADTANEELLDTLELAFPNECLWHTTYSSTPDNLRVRVIIPLDRPVAPDEYHRIVSVLMERFGLQHFDPGSLQPERYMFRPAARELEWYRHGRIEGPAAEADVLLAGWDPDLHTAPEPRLRASKRDPFSLEGVIGAFNRAYDIQAAIDAYDLPYDAVGAERWQLHGARAESGLHLIAEGLVFSHHVTDPAAGKTCSAFDLVRLHKYGHLDEDSPLDTPVNRLPSHLAMLDKASTDALVVAELVGLDFTEQDVADEEWRLGLQFDRQGRLRDQISNWDLISKHDPVFQGLYYNEMTLAVETDADLPWRPKAQGGATFTDMDRQALTLYLERLFHVRPARQLLDMVITDTVMKRFRNPVLDYLLALKWDGVPRLETSLPGVRPTPYTRLVARKVLTAAVARMLHPGIKWDHTLVLFGSEGLGKTFWIERMSRGYSATLGRINDKDTLLTMQRSWIMVSDEGHSLRKADAEAQKEFLTRTEDVFRLPYDREAQAHKRHCVIWGTTNDEVFLRRQEGNRRFLIVRCEDSVDFEAVTPEYVEQVWAEAVALFQAGELLFLTEEETVLASNEREQFVEEDALRGIIEQYLDTLVPNDWATRSPADRVLWLANHASGLVDPGTEPIRRVCSAQLWTEAMGRRFGEHSRMDLLDLTKAMKDVPGWRQLPHRVRMDHYGPQTVFERLDGSELL